MKHAWILIASSLLLAAQAPQDVSYRFDEVHSKVLLDRARETLKVKAGDQGLGGDVVRTGWRGRAIVSSPQAASRFEIYPGSRVELASSGTPGVLVSVQHGRLKAIFDVFKGDDERLVETPGALLAVRGTRYGVEVDRNGLAIVTVFEGTVEIRPFDASIPPRLLPAGQICEIARGKPLRVHPAPRGINENEWGKKRTSGSRAGDRPTDRQRGGPPHERVGEPSKQPPKQPDRGRPH